jgi:predicted PurR-regulated permease PerM
MIGNPLMQFFRKYVNKNVAAGLTLTTFLLLIVFMISVFIPPLVTQARNLAQIDYKAVANGLEEPIDDWKNWLEKYGLIEEHTIDTIALKNAVKEDDKIYTQWIDLDSLKLSQGDSTSIDGTQLAILINVEVDDASPPVEEVEDSGGFIEQVQSNLFTFLNPSRISGLFSSLVGFFGNLLIALLSILFISFFFLKEQGLFDKILGSIVPNQYEGETVQAINESSQLLIRYFIGVVAQITVITIVVSVGLTLMGINNALLIAFFAALMNVIPYVGPLFGATFGIIITISSHLDLPFYSGMLPLLVKVLIVFAIMQLLDNFILQPTIFGRSVKAHPLEIFIVVLIGAKLGGILGMVVAIPAYTVLRVIGKVFFSEFKVVQRITEGL